MIDARASQNGHSTVGNDKTVSESSASDGGWTSRLVNGMLRRRFVVLLAVHSLLLVAAYSLAFLLRFDLKIPQNYLQVFWKTLPWVLLAKLVAFRLFGSFHGWWRYVTFADLAVLLRVAVLSSAAVAVVDLLMFPHIQIPRSVLLIDCGATILLIGGTRSTWRMFREHVWTGDLSQNRRTFMIGALDGGEGFVNQIHKNTQLNYRIIGFLDDNRNFHGSRLGGIPFLGGPNDLVSLALRHNVQDVLVIANSIPGSQLRELIADCRNNGITVKMLPRVEELLHGADRLQVRDVNINDLLRREEIKLDLASISEMLRSRVVMVTGAGGSIGSEICRQVMKHAPRRLVLVERAENSLYHIENELNKLECADAVIGCVGDVGDKSRMERIFAQFQPEIVFHAAAHKHVPLMERNPGEAIENNVLGTKTVADLADRYQAKRFVMISTDKAVNPTSVMGVSKQIAERYVHAFSEISKTKFVVVRFGNVLASAGSVVPLFLDQIRRGGPITVTHPDMERFFMTIPEASRLVLQAAAQGNGGEIFVLDMGKPVKIVDLARDLLHLAGLSSRDIEIQFVGTRPGEKLFEELYFDEEQMLETSHPKIRAAYHRPHSLEEVNELINQISPLIHAGAEVIHQKLQELIPEYQRPECDLTPQPELEPSPVASPMPARLSPQPQPIA